MSCNEKLFLLVLDENLTISCFLIESLVLLSLHQRLANHAVYIDHDILGASVHLELVKQDR
jgi:hypothetical protein